MAFRFVLFFARPLTLVVWWDAIPGSNLAGGDSDTREIWGQSE